MVRVIFLSLIILVSTVEAKELHKTVVFVPAKTSRALKKHIKVELRREAKSYGERIKVRIRPFVFKHKDPANRLEKIFILLEVSTKLQAKLKNIKRHKYHKLAWFPILNERHPFDGTGIAWGTCIAAEQRHAGIMWANHPLIIVKGLLHELLHLWGAGHRDWDDPRNCLMGTWFHRIWADTGKPPVVCEETIREIRGCLT